jgi:hypothetical protein
MSGKLEELPQRLHGELSTKMFSGCTFHQCNMMQQPPAIPIKIVHAAGENIVLQQ